MAKTFLICVLLLAVAVMVSAKCPKPANSQINGFKFVGVDSTCDGDYPQCTLCCRNFLSCLPITGNRTCVETFQNMTCSPLDVNACGQGMLCVRSNADTSVHVCVIPSSLGVGDLCVSDSQCQFNAKCGEVSRPASRDLEFRFDASAAAAAAESVWMCAPGAANVTRCTSQADCGDGLWCNEQEQLCQQPVKKGADCTAGANVATPNYVCESGSGCMQTGSDPVQFNCTKYYSQEPKHSFCTLNTWWSCEYGSYCSANSTQAGKCVTGNQDGALGNSCKNFPLTLGDQEECPYGSACSCFRGDTTGKGQCSRFFNTNCATQNENFVSCLKKYKCPHDPSQLIGSSISPFAGSTVWGSCADQNCRKQHGSLIRCQNQDIKSSDSPAYVPRQFPNNVHESSSGGLEGWEIGLIIVGIAVAVIIIVVVVVAVVRRKKKSQYQPLD